MVEPRGGGGGGALFVAHLHVTLFLDNFMFRKFKVKSRTSEGGTVLHRNRESPAPNL